MADPRTEDVAETLNEALQDRAIFHAVQIEGFKNSEVRKILSFIDDELLPDLINQLERRLGRITERGFDLGPVTTQRLRTMIAGLQGITASFTRDQYLRLRDDLTAFAIQEASLAAAAATAVLPGEVSLEVVLPAARQLRSAVISQPMDGAVMREWFRELSRKTQLDLGREIRIAFAAGETISQVETRVRGLIKGQYKRQTEAIARTAISNVSNHARESLYAANPDIVKSVQWIATLDTRTCPECMSLDGRVFEPGVGPRPPAHFNCRCTTAPVVKSFEELGLDADEFPPGARASIDGAVPETLTYGQWLRRLSKKKGGRSLVRDALGPSRGKLFMDGGLDVTDFVDRRGNVLRLDQLAVREETAFVKAGLDI